MMIRCDNLVKIYKTAHLEVVALQGLDLSVEEGELMAVIGNSGSGKSTLLNMLGGLDKPSAGQLFVNGQNLLQFGGQELTRYKRETVGFVWQNKARNLIPYLTALENVEIPLLLRGKRKRERALELIDAVGLSHRRRHTLSELSGGEQQRVAIAIALANRPKLLLADEPTGSVDTRTADLILELFRRLNRELGLTIVIVTHDPRLAGRVDRVVAIRDGKTSSELIRRKSYADEPAETPGLEPQHESAETSGSELRRESTERQEAASRPENGAVEETHEEYAVLDHAGRLQIPGHYLQALAGDEEADRIRKVKLALEDDRVIMTVPRG